MAWLLLLFLVTLNFAYWLISNWKKWCVLLLFSMNNKLANLSKRIIVWHNNMLWARTILSKKNTRTTGPYSIINYNGFNTFLFIYFTKVFILHFNTIHLEHRNFDHYIIINYSWRIWYRIDVWMLIKLTKIWSFPNANNSYIQDKEETFNSCSHVPLWLSTIKSLIIILLLHWTLMNIDLVRKFENEVTSYPV